MSEISVKVTKFKDRKFLLMYYDDPLTGKRVTRSTKQTNEREARKAAGKYDRGDVGGRYCHVLNRQARLLYTAQAACLRGAALKACDSVSISPVSVAS